jgi:cbb3-type cytochrome oxidase subunit 3
MEEEEMINKILERGFIALAAYSYLFALISLILFVVAVVANAFIKNGKFDVAEIRKLLFNNMIFMLVFALLDYFLV